MKKKIKFVIVIIIIPLAIGAVLLGYVLYKKATLSGLTTSSDAINIPETNPLEKIEVNPFEDYQNPFE